MKLSLKGGLILLAILVLPLLVGAAAGGIGSPGQRSGADFYRCVEGEQFPAYYPEPYLPENLVWFTATHTPPASPPCAVTIHNGGNSSKRVMEVDFPLPLHLVTGERFSYDFDDTNWECRIEGTDWVPVYKTTNWKFTAKPDGSLTGKCTCTVDYDDPSVCKESL